MPSEKTKRRETHNNTRGEKNIYKQFLPEKPWKGKEKANTPASV